MQARNQESNKPTTPAERAAIILQYMAALGVQREELESAIGARIEEFSKEETYIISQAAKKMKRNNLDFPTAFKEASNEVYQ